MVAQMEDSEFERLADTALKHIETVVEAMDGDLDCSMTSSGVLEIESERGRIVVNRHGAAREIWVAAKSGGFHYRWDGEHWRDTRSGEELMSALSALLGAHA